MTRPTTSGRGALALLLGALLLALFCATAAAQTGTSSVRGTVTDPQGNVVPGATVTLSNAEKNFTRTQTTTGEGGYVFASVPPGRYRLEVEAKGFKKSVANEVQALVNTTTDQNVQLEVGNVSETVSISASTEAPLNTTDATVGNTFTEHQILQLPLEARNVAGLLSLQPGVTFIGNTDATGQTNDYRNGSVNGGKSDQSNVTLDGVDVNDQQTGQAFNSALRITLDSVQEFRVVTTNPNAEQGRSSGAQVSLVTKSGTNDWHGSAYEFHRNTVTSANDFFNNAAGSFGPNDLAVRVGQAQVGQPRIPRPKLLRNVFGGSVSGPIRKDRLFFFFNYEGRRDSREEPQVRVVPSLALRQGIFTYVSTSGAIKTLSPADVTALDPNHLGPNPAMLAVFNQYPAPNDTSVGDGLNTQGFRFNSPIHLRWNTYITRLDYNINSKHTVYWRGNLQNDKDNGAQQFPGAQAQPVGGDGARGIGAGPFNQSLTGAPLTINLTNNKGFATGYTATLSSTLVNVLRLGYTRVGFESIGQSPTSGAPLVSIRTLDDLFPATRSLRRVNPTWNVTDDVAWTSGTHSMQFGGNVRWIRNDRVNFTTSFHSAFINKSWLLSARPLRPADLSSTFRVADHAMAALLGLVSQVTARYNLDRGGSGLVLLPQGAPIRRKYAADEYEAYAQDSWRFRQNLTFTYGVRYSLYSPPWEQRGLQVAPSTPLGQWFDMRGQAMRQGQPSNASVPDISFDLAGPVNHRPGFYNWDKNNFAPRFAFAYSPDFKSGFMKTLTGGPGRTSIRGGYSMVYDRIGGSIATNAEQGALSFGISTQFTNAAGVQRANTAPRFTGLTNIPPQLLVPSPGTQLPILFPKDINNGFAITAGIDDHIKTPYSQSINLSVSRELPGKMVFEAAYVGRLGRHIRVNSDLAMPTDIVDPASGMDYFTAAQALVRADFAGTPVSQIQPIPFWEHLFPGYASGNLTATQVIYRDFYSIATGDGPDYTTSLFDLDVVCGPCSKLGPYALFDDQFSNLNALRTIMPTNYHALQLLLRHRLSRGFQFDVNYTFSKSEDWASTIERTTLFTGTGSIINSWEPQKRKAVSDYDIKHQLNVNGLWELPMGKGRFFLHDAPGWADAIFGGWQLSSIFRLTSGLPVSIGNGLQFPTNWEFTGNATQTRPISNTGGHRCVVITAGRGCTPNLFTDPTAALNSFQFTMPGEVGTRNLLRGDGYFSLDAGLAKSWRMPFNEKHTLQFRWEVFNVTNSVTFDASGSANGGVIISSLDDRNTFGKYTRTLSQPRVMQFGLRYEF